MTDEPLLTPEDIARIVGMSPTYVRDKLSKKRGFPWCSVNQQWCRRRGTNSEHGRGLYGRMCNPCARTNCVFRNTGRIHSIATATMSRYDYYIATRNPEQAT